MCGKRKRKRKKKKKKKKNGKSVKRKVPGLNNTWIDKQNPYLTIQTKKKKTLKLLRNEKGKKIL